MKKIIQIIKSLKQITNYDEVIKEVKIKKNVRKL